MNLERDLRGAIADGEFSAFGEVYTDDARLDASLVGERVRASGPVAIADALDARFGGRGSVVEWSAKRHPEGMELWVERIGPEGSVVRTRQYLHTHDGGVARHWIYAAPPRTPPEGADSGPTPTLDPGLLSALGEVVGHEPIVSIGWSGNVLERVGLADGTRLVAKRVIPGANWLDRHTEDEGREALLFKSGVLDQVPGAIDHTIVAAERDGDAWWIVMRDVSDRLLPDGARLTRDQGAQIMRCANLMWEEFWGEQVPHLSPPRTCFSVFSPTVAAAERQGLDLLPKQYEAFWEAFAEAVDDDVAGGVLALHEDPAPLVDELDLAARR